jgi:hypothetical protein
MKSAVPKIFLAVAVLVALMAGGLVVSYRTGKSDLEKWKARMRAKGEKLSLQELVPSGKSRTNDPIHALLEAVDQLQVTVVHPGEIPGMAIATPGHARVAWQEEALLWGRGRTCSWPRFEAQFEQAQDALEQLREVLKDPPPDSGANYQNLSSSPAGQLVGIRKAVQWLWGATLNELHRGNLDGASSNLHALLGAARLHEEQWILVDQMIRVAITRLATSSTWEALQAPGWTDAQLARLQADWQSVRLLEQFEKTFQVERAAVLFHFDDARKNGPKSSGSTTGFSSTNFLADSFNDFVYGPVWRIAWSHQDELFYLEGMELTLEGIRAGTTSHAWTAMQPKVKAAQIKLKNLSWYNRFRYSLTQVAVPNWEKAVVTLIRTETMKQMVITAIALKRFQLQHGKAPPNLPALVPEFLPAVPLDYMDGQPLRYRLKDDGTWTLYSVGEDGQDDGGDSMPASSWLYQSDVWNGRDVVWPSVANDSDSEPQPQIVPLIVIQDVPLMEAVKRLAKQAALDVQIDPQVTEYLSANKESFTVNIRMEDKTAEDALKAALSAAKLTWIKVPGTNRAGITLK